MGVPEKSELPAAANSLAEWNGKFYGELAYLSQQSEDPYFQAMCKQSPQALAEQPKLSDAVNLALEHDPDLTPQDAVHRFVRATQDIARITDKYYPLNYEQPEKWESIFRIDYHIRKFSELRPIYKRGPSVDCILAAVPEHVDAVDITFASRAIKR